MKIKEGPVELKNIKPQDTIKYISLGTAKQIMYSKWCVNCYPDLESAKFTFKGNSLCENCFKLLNSPKPKTKV